MIAKRIDRTSSDRFGRLAEYIAAASDKGEKLHTLWIENCDAGAEIEDLRLAIKEVEATQQQNNRSRKDKTYHLLVSFRDQQPSVEDLREIEAAYAEALGFAEHQRIVATHQNTENFHMHVAINKVHPTTLRNRTPHRDFYILEKTSRELEKRFGLKVDVGLSDKQAAGISAKARDFEAHTWQQSFERHVKEMKPALMDDLARATDWGSLHDALQDRGLRIRKRGAGLVITDAKEKQAIKASSLDRTWSAKSLKERFGPFQPPERDRPQAPAGRSAYRRRPLFPHPNTGRLWRRFLGLRRRPGQAMGMTTWKQFLMLQAALDDPLATAIIMYRNKVMNTLVSLVPARPRFPMRGIIGFGAGDDSAAARTAGNEWREAKWADAKTTPYLVKKGVRGFMVKARSDGSLLVPARAEPKGRIVDLFVIETDGREGFMSGGPAPGLHHLIDPEEGIGQGGPVVVAQDYATAAGLHQASRVPVAVAFTPENMVAVASELRAADPGRRIVVAADAGNVVEASEAASQVRGQVVASPAGTFNDHIRKHGPQAVRRLLAEPLADEAFLLWDRATWSKTRGLKTAKDGGLLIPGRDIHGNLVSVFTVEKLDQAPVPAAGPSDRQDLVHILDPEKTLAEGKAAQIALATTVADAEKLHNKLKVPVVTVLSPAGQETVAKTITRRWPKTLVVNRRKNRDYYKKK